MKIKLDKKDSKLIYDKVITPFSNVFLRRLPLLHAVELKIKSKAYMITRIK